jgi:octaprenyl-diphosphate synthase
MHLSEILQPISEELDQVEAEIGRQVARIGEIAFGAEQKFLRDTVDYFFGVPGKRLRPSLVLLSARSFSSDPDISDYLVKVSAAAELMHSASLVHDDIIDGEELRRGQQSLNAVHGNTVAVLVGDLYYAQFFDLLTELTALGTTMQKRLFDLFLGTTRKMCMAEIYEEGFRLRGERTSLDDYLLIIENKTASLMAACCEAGAVVAGAPRSQIEAIAAFGTSVGLAYQLVDDTIDEDASLADRQLITSRALREGEHALERARSLPPGTARDRLQAMVDYVIRKINTHQAAQA